MLLFYFLIVYIIVWDQFISQQMKDDKRKNKNY